MHFDDLDVEVRVQDGGNLAGQLGQQIDPDAHVRRPHDRNLGGAVGHHCVLLRLKARGSRNQRRPGLGGEPGMGHGGFGNGEIQDHVGSPEQALGLVTDNNAKRFEARLRAQVAADRLNPWVLFHWLAAKTWII